MDLTIGLHGFNMYAGADRDGMARIVEMAEELGYDSLWAADHVVLPSPRTASSPMEPTDPLVDPLLALTFAAARTERIGLATGVVVLPQRDPLILAKQFASLDVLSGGRTTAGLGAGYLEPELSRFGVSLFERGRRTEEHLAAMRALWHTQAPEFHGDFVSFANIDAHPRPLQQPLPVVLGGNSPVAQRRAVRLADGWYGWMLGLRATAESLDSLRAAGHGTTRDLHISITPARRLTPEAVQTYADLGVHRLIVAPPTGLPLSALTKFIQANAPATLGAKPHK